MTVKKLTHKLPYLYINKCGLNLANYIMHISKYYILYLLLKLLINKTI